MWVYFRLPEPKGRTYAELDILFERRVTARDFSKTDTNPFRGETVDVVNETTEKDITKDAREVEYKEYVY